MIFEENFENNLDFLTSEKSQKEQQDSLKNFFRLESFEGMSFLDMGCGSGVFSLAAAKLGAEKVLSFDLYTELARKVRETTNEEIKSKWEIEEGSVLDKDYLQKVGQFDLVYCWGVLHHCGELIKGLDLCLENVSPQGRIYLGIYNHADGLAVYPDGRFGSSETWKKIKKSLASKPDFIKNTIIFICTILIFIIFTLSLRNPFKELREIEDRGMGWKTAMIDWLFGHPYEFATPEEIVDIAYKKGFRLIKIWTNNGLRTNHYVFERVS